MCSNRWLADGLWAVGEVLRECSWKGDVARLGDLPRNVLDSSGRRDFDLAALERLRHLLRPLETSSFMPGVVTCRKWSKFSIARDIFCVRRKQLRDVVPSLVAREDCL